MSIGLIMKPKISIVPKAIPKEKHTPDDTVYVSKWGTRVRIIEYWDNGVECIGAALKDGHRMIYKLSDLTRE